MAGKGKRSRTGAPPLLLTVAIAAIGAGCGGDGSSGSDDAIATASVPKGEFVKRAEQICNRERQKAFASKAKTELEVVQESILPAIQSSIEGVRSLGAPPGDEARVEEILDSMHQAVDDGEEQGAATIGEVEELFDESATLARKYGIASCAYS